MIQFIKARWQSVALIISCILIGILLMQLCTNKPVPTYKDSTDSLVHANKQKEAYFSHVSDSISKVVKEKDQAVSTLSNRLKSIEYKYTLLRNAKPSVDTVVKTHVVYQGQEAIEKVPVLESQVLICQSEVVDLKNLVKVKTDQNLSLQNQFDRAIVISQSQEKEMKKANRKAKWMKIGLVAESVVLLGAAVFVIIK